MLKSDKIDIGSGRLDNRVLKPPVCIKNLLSFVLPQFLYLYWDTKDGLTFVKGNKGGAGVVEWSNVQEISIPSDGPSRE